MKKFVLATLIAVVAVWPAALRSQTPVALSTLTANNTSACTAVDEPDDGCYAAFAGLSDPHFNPSIYEPQPQNVSKVSISSLMYSNSNTFIFTHYQPWFYQGNTQKIATGYNSNTTYTVAAQMKDMASRGFKGVVIDWYGEYGGDSKGYDNGTTEKIGSNLAAKCTSTQDCPFYFAIMEDKGALAYNGCSQSPGTSSIAACEAALETDLTYMNSEYFGSKAYLKLTAPPGNAISSAGRPVVFLFLLTAPSYSIGEAGWTTVWADVAAWAQTNAGNPLFWFESDFTPQATYGYPNTDADGAYGWINWNNTITPYIGLYDTGDLYGFDALQGFYYNSYYGSGSGGYYETQAVAGVGYKGFDDYDSWGTVPNYHHPVIAQDCGQTFVQSIQTYAGEYYNSTTQLPFLGVAVWNDYDEGSEIETGIDNCVSSFTASLSGSTLNWNIAFYDYNAENQGSETTVYNYVIYYTTNGTSLTKAGTVPSGTHTTDLCTLHKSIPTGATLYVQAQGQPSIFNHLASTSTTYTNSCT